MNVALPALVVFVFLLPGFIARSRIKRVERLSLDYSPFGLVVTEAVVWAAGLHVVWIVAMEQFSMREFRAGVALKLLSADAAGQTRALEAVAAQAPSVTLYFGTMIAFAYLAPLAVRKLITGLRLDRVGSRFSGWLRFSGAPWYYLLSGADFQQDKIPDFIAISAVVNIAGKPFLYTGILDDYFLDHDGKLDRLILQEVMRRPLDRDKVEPPADTDTDTDAQIQRDVDRFYPVDGDYFVLRYSEAITLNVEYIKLART